MQKINQPVVPSDIAYTVEECVAIANKIGYPVIVRPAYTLGGAGGGVAHDEEELRLISPPREASRLSGFSLRIIRFKVSAVKGSR